MCLVPRLGVLSFPAASPSLLTLLARRLGASSFPLVLPGSSCGGGAGLPAEHGNATVCWGAPASHGAVRKEGSPGAHGQPSGTEGPLQAPGEAAKNPKGAGLCGGGGAAGGPLRAGGTAFAQGPQERSRGRPLPLRSHIALSSAVDLSAPRSPRTFHPPRSAG